MQAAAVSIERARARGVDVAADLYPYTAGGTGLEATVPSWVFDGGLDVAPRPTLNRSARERSEGSRWPGLRMPADIRDLICLMIRSVGL